MEPIVVTRHPALVEYLKERGIIGDGVEVIPHVASDDQVAGKRVVGVLPYRLASLASSVVVVDLDVPADKRGAELSLDDIRAYVRWINEYIVIPRKVRDMAEQALSAPREPWPVAGHVATFSVTYNQSALRRAELDLLDRTKCEIVALSDVAGMYTVEVYCPNDVEVGKARVIIGREFGLVPPDYVVRAGADPRITLYEDADGMRWCYAYECVENTGAWWARGIRG